jgi:predicted SAM-dependent methyltransferase
MKKRKLSGEKYFGSTRQLKCINLGCGDEIMESDENEKWINLDCDKGKGIDIVMDLNKLPLKFKDKEFDIIQAHNIIEHLKPDIEDIFMELSRILKDGGKIFITVPHPTQPGYCHIFHYKHFWLRSLDTENTADLMKKNMMRKAKLALTCKKIIFHIKLFYLKPIEFLVNLSDKSQTIYEHTFLRYIFPAHEYLFVLKKTS